MFPIQNIPNLNLLPSSSCRELRDSDTPTLVALVLPATDKTLKDVQHHNYPNSIRGGLFNKKGIYFNFPNSVQKTGCSYQIDIFS